jgi:hypothetical protein
MAKFLGTTRPLKKPSKNRFDLKYIPLKFHLKIIPEHVLEDWRVMPDKVATCAKLVSEGVHVREFLQSFSVVVTSPLLPAFQNLIRQIQDQRNPYF